MTSFSKQNNLIGWALFAISTLVYILTLEPTASFWDPGEFIAVSYKLQVPHPPGAPFFLLVNRMFSMLAFGNVEMVAWWINLSSALCSGATIMLMYWTIVMLGLKLLKIKTETEETGQKIALFGAGVVGALMYAFSDSFWFSAVESEVYAMSSFFTAWVIWAFFRWERIEDEELEQRWLILIAFMMGLSIGVHLLNLVTIPALALVYYFKKHTLSIKGLIGSLLVGGIILVIINNGVITGLPSIVGAIEVFFVNSLGLPFNVGIVVFILLFIGALLFGIRYTYKTERPLLNTALLCFAYILIGYSSYTLVLIRSNFDTPINENAPKSLMSFISYLKREQYGDRPLLYGQYFTARPIDQKLGAAVYYKGEDRYEVADYRLNNIYAPEESTILPRTWSTSPNHAQAYREKLGLPQGKQPTFSQNLKFMFSHQMGHMYWRYFMWNFAGRASDIQDASWLSPFDSTKGMPDTLANNKARNQYFMLPLLLGIIGLLFQYKEDFNNFLVVTMLFLMMGLVLILYLNSPPTEPRERDYIYVGSFYAFAFWVGLGVLAIYQYLIKALQNRTAVAAGVVAVSMVVPGIVLAENWDDHNRTARYFSVDSARNMLAAIAPNGILFTGGDNDTFPLWYIQEVEGFRTDVRVVVLSYFDTDWYVNQMTRQVNDSPPFPFSLTEDNYRYGTNDYLPLVESSNENIKRGVNAASFLNLIRNENENLKIPTQAGKPLYATPSRNFFLDVDTSAVLEKGIIPEELQPFMVSRMEWSMKGDYISKGNLMLMDLIVNNNWERPIYFNNTSLMTINFDLKDYIVQEGVVYRLLPVKRPEDWQFEHLINPDKMYNVMMNEMRFRGMNDPNIYLSQDYKFFALNHRTAFNELASVLLWWEREDQAREVILKSLEVMPDEGVNFDFASLQSVEILFQVGERDKAKEVSEKLATDAYQMLKYMVMIDKEIGNQLQLNYAILLNLQRVMNRYEETELAEKYESMLQEIFDETGVDRLRF
jgi:hypothetical protein